MDLKLRNNVNIEGFTFQKRVIEESLELIGRKKNYIDNDIKFVVMLAFCNNLVQDNLIIESLYDEDKLEEKIENIVEPFFREQVLNIPEIKEIFDGIVCQIISYMDREYNSRNHISGFIYDLFSDLGDLTMDDIEKLLKSIMTLIPMRDNKIAAPGKIESKQNDREIKQEVLNDIENLKMKAFMEKFARENNEDRKESAN